LKTNPERELWEAINNIAPSTKDKLRIKDLETRLDAIKVLNDDNQRLVVQQTQCLGELAGELEEIGDSCGKIAEICAYD
jgi:hypothetical protein